MLIYSVRIPYSFALLFQAACCIFKGKILSVHRFLLSRFYFFTSSFSSSSLSSMSTISSRTFYPHLRLAPFQYTDRCATLPTFSARYLTRCSPIPQHRFSILRRLCRSSLQFDANASPSANAACRADDEATAVVVLFPSRVSLQPWDRKSVV